MRRVHVSRTDPRVNITNPALDETGRFNVPVGYYHTAEGIAQCPTCGYLDSEGAEFDCPDCGDQMISWLGLDSMRQGDNY